MNSSLYSEASLSVDIDSLSSFSAAGLNIMGKISEFKLIYNHPKVKFNLAKHGSLSQII